MLEMIPCFLNIVDQLFRSVEGNKSPSVLDDWGNTTGCQTSQS